MPSHEAHANAYASYEDSRAAWCPHHQTLALAGLHALGKSDYFEVCAEVNPALQVRRQSALLEAARASNIHTFGWPIAIVFEGSDESPKPTRDGIVAEIPWEERSTYDYWALAHWVVLPAGDTLRRRSWRLRPLLLQHAPSEGRKTVMFLASLYRALGASDAAASI